MARTAPKKRTPAKPLAKPLAKPVVENSDGTGQPIENIGSDGKVKPVDMPQDSRQEGENSDGTGYRMEYATGDHVKDAVNNPAIISRRSHSEDLNTPAERDVQFVNRGGQIERKDQSLIEAEPVHGSNDLAAHLAFLEEKVTVILSEGNNKQSEPYVYLAVNGEGAGPKGIEYVPRGVEVTIKRKFLSVLATARHVRYKSVDYTEADGTLNTTQKAMSNDQYPFSVVNDSAKGHAWLKALRQSRRN